MASKIPKEVKKAITDAYVAETTWKVALLTALPDDTISTYAGITTEVVGAGYTATGATLAGRASAYTGTDAWIDATDTSWTSATFTATHAVVYETAGGLIRAIYDLGGSKTVTTGTFTLVWNASGLLTVTS
jgi:hypothetical protein